MKKFRVHQLPVIYVIAAIISLVGLIFITNKIKAQGIDYHSSYDSIINDLKAITDKNPSIAAMVPLEPKTIEGRTVWAIKISKDPLIQKNKNRILFEGTHHAREWVAAEVSFYLAKYLMENYASNPKIKSYIDNEEIWIIPVANPDGYQYTKGSGSNSRMWRKNRRNNGISCSNIDTGWGVDNNRNYGPNWNAGGSSNNCMDETYMGTSAYSEPENQMIRDLLKKYSFSTVLSYHSYSQLVLYPYGYTNSPAPDKPLLDTMANKIADLIKSVHGQINTPQQEIQLYPVSGDTSDHVYDTYSIPAFTIELRPTGFWDGGFLLPSNQIMPTFEENTPAALYLIDLLNPDIQTPTQTQPIIVNPGQSIKITAKGIWRGKTNTDFKVEIGGIDAPVRTVTRLQEMGSSGAQFAYDLTVQVPQNTVGKCDLKVIVGDASDIEKEAITNGTGACGNSTPPTPTQPQPSSIIAPTTIPPIVTTTPIPTLNIPTPTGQVIPTKILTPVPTLSIIPTPVVCPTNQPQPTLSQTPAPSMAITPTSGVKPTVAPIPSPSPTPTPQPPDNIGDVLKKILELILKLIELILKLIMPK